MDAPRKNDKKVINGWALFDWANSAYFLVISTAVFPIYYEAVTEDTVSVFNSTISTTALYSYAVSFAYVLLALMTPILSGMADFAGRRLRYLIVFTWLGSLACIGMYFFDNPEDIWMAISLFVLSTIGAGGGIVFYNAFLPEIATEDQYDAVSARGYAFGYIGSVMLLAFCLFMIQKPELFGFTSESMPTRITFALVGLWWLGFAHVSFNRLPKDTPRKVTNLVRRGFGELALVWGKVRSQGNIVRFLASFLCYMAGVQTVIYLCTIFASVELEMESDGLILAILIIQLVAVVGALFFARVSKWVGNRNSLIIQISIWILICIGAYFVQTANQFFIIAGCAGLVLGGIQSLSRATYAKLIERGAENLTSYFSFYDVLMKLSLVGGAFLFGLAEQITGDMRNSVLTITVVFVIGLILMWTVQSKRLQGQP